MASQNPFLILNRNAGGLFTAFNVTAAAVLRVGAGTVMRISVITAGTAGALALNDCATTGAAVIGNQLAGIPFALLTAGNVITLEFPYQTGLVVSTVGTGSVVAISYF